MKNELFTAEIGEVEEKDYSSIGMEIIRVPVITVYSRDGKAKSPRATTALIYKLAAELERRCGQADVAWTVNVEPWKGEVSIRIDRSGSDNKAAAMARDLVREMGLK